MKSKTALKWDHIQLGAGLADLRNDHYRTFLMLSSLVELCIEKGLLTESELANRMATIDRGLDTAISGAPHPTP